jgi:hypothetical protein
MRSLVVLVSISSTLANSAAADPVSSARLRILVRPADGEILARHCEGDVAKHVWRIVMKRPYVEVIDGKMAVRIHERQPTPAQRQQDGEELVAFYDVTDTRTVAFGVRWRDARGRRVPIEIAVIVRDPLRARFCRETWLGLGELI